MSWIEDFRRDVPYALRGLRRNPTFALAAVATLAIGIGAATAISTAVGAILFAPLPYPESDRLVRLVARTPPALPGRPVRRSSLTHGEFLEWRLRTTTLSVMAATVWDPQVMVSTPGGAARLSGGLASPDWFRLLGDRAMLGRTLEPEDVRERRDVVVLSARAWRQHFGSDPNVIGRTTTLQSRIRRLMNGRPMEIVGVMPDTFDDPSGYVEFWAPLVPTADAQSVAVQVFGRLAPGVTIAAAREEANAIRASLRPSAPEDPERGRAVDVDFLKDRLVAPVRPALQLMLGAVAIVLIIVCANMAGLLLARGTARRREIAVRLALGASRGRLTRQLLCESLMVSLGGGILGAALGSLGLVTIRGLGTVEAPGVFRLAFGGTLLPRVTELAVEANVLVFAMALSIVASAIFGLGPSLHLSRSAHAEMLGARGSSSRPREDRIRSGLVVGQLVLATALLVAAGLLMRSFDRLRHVETGYDPRHVLAFQLVVPEEYPTARKTSVIEAILARLRAKPGIQVAGFSYAGALVGVVDTVGYFVPPGRTESEIREGGAFPHLRSIDHGYLSAVGVRLLAGRGLTPQDIASAPPVVLINRRLARHYFADANPVGARLSWHGHGSEPIDVEIVGVVDDVRHGRLDKEPAPEVLIGYLQLLAILERWNTPKEQRELLALGFMSFAVRTAGDPAALAPAVRSVVTAVDPQAGIDAVAPLEDLQASSIARPRFYAVLLSVFAITAALLAVVGIYGVMAYAVSQRTREIGVRVALGAERRAVLGLVLRRGLLLTTVGVGVGLGAAVGLSQYLSSLLFGVTPLDSTTYVAVAVIFAGAAATASYVPARRALKVDPASALRAE